MRLDDSSKAAREQAIARFDVDDLTADEFAADEGFAAVAYLFEQADTHWPAVESAAYDDAVDALETALIAEGERVIGRTGVEFDAGSA